MEAAKCEHLQIEHSIIGLYGPISYILQIHLYRELLRLIHWTLILLSLIISIGSMETSTNWIQIGALNYKPIWDYFLYVSVTSYKELLNE